VSTRGAHRGSQWIDDATGLLVGEVGEAYLMAADDSAADGTGAVVVLAIDRLEAYRSVQGDDAARTILSRVARAVQHLSANVGVIAAAYRHGMIMLVGPELSAELARELGERLCKAVATLEMANAESIVADHVTASVAVATGPAGASRERMNLLSNAISTARNAQAAGGNRLVAVAL
jgi:GGDEF domain-containing protein